MSSAYHATRPVSKILKNPLSLDSNLEELILSLEEIATTTFNGHVYLSLTKCTLSVAKHLLKNEAILLCDAYDMLIHPPNYTPPTYTQTTTDLTLSKAQALDIFPPRAPRVQSSRLVSSCTEGVAT